MLVTSALSLALLVQSPAVRRLEHPEATLQHEFTQIRGLVELSDGRVLVADRLEEAVSVGDFRRGSVTRIGRSGGGPEEYRLPAGLVPMLGDSALIIDEGNNRLGFIGPDLRLGTRPKPRVPGLPDGLWPRAVDANGRYYALIPGWMLFGLGRSRDSLPLLRFTPAGSPFDTLAWLHPAPEPPPPPRRDRPRIPMLVFAPGDAWAVTSSGRIAVIRAKDYSVEWFDANGARTHGPPTPWQALDVAQPDKLDYTRNFLANSGIGGKGGGDRPPGGLVATPADMLTDEQVADLAANTAFARTRPPFTDARPRTAPDGTLWVERSVPRGSPSRWDVFDERGRLAMQVELPLGRRLIEVGRGSLYAALVNADGIERLERYRR